MPSTARRLRPARTARPPLQLAAPEPAHARAFLAAVENSRALHARWVEPPDTRSAYRAYLERIEAGRCIGHLVLVEDDALAGVVNLGEVLRGGYQSAQLSYYAFAPHAGRGLMREAVRRVITLAFREHGLNRLEAAIQPANTASRALAASLGLRHEGLCTRYMKINGRWRDHERWAITAGEWRLSRCRRER